MSDSLIKERNDLATGAIQGLCKSIGFNGTQHCVTLSTGRRSRVFADEGIITEYKDKLTDLCEHIKICSGHAQNLQKEANEWSGKRGELEENLRQTDDDINNLEKQSCRIEYCIRVMNFLLEADEKQKGLSEAMAYFKSKQSRLMDKIMDHNKKYFKNSEHQKGVW